MQIAANIVEPFGEQRADVRAAWNTIKQVSQEGDRTLGDIFDTLTQYAEGERKNAGELEADPEALARIKTRTP